MTNATNAQTDVTITANDGFALAATRFSSARSELPHGLVIVNCATGAPARYYHRYARFLTKNGFDALTWDYRGIAASRPPSMRGFQANMMMWGELDFTAVMAYAIHNTALRNIPIYVIGHSIGGFLPGLTEHNVHIKKLITVGAQLAYWPDYWWRKRVQMLLTWHGFAPVVTAAAGYFPASRLGLGEDLPSGVIRDWIATKRKAAILQPAFDQCPLPTHYARFESLTAPTLAYSFTDDEFATEIAVQRIFALMRSTKPEHRRLTPAQIGTESIGHFGFFLDKFNATLWPETVTWFR